MNDMDLIRCVDIDECAAGDVECPLNSACFNLDPGSADNNDAKPFECRCEPGFSPVFEEGVLVSCSKCGFEFGFPDFFTVTNGDGNAMPDMPGASQDDICSSEQNTRSCKVHGKGISVKGSVANSGCKCNGVEADDDQCIGDENKDFDYECNCVFEECSFTEWEETECKILEGVSCGPPDYENKQNYRE